MRILFAEAVLWFIHLMLCCSTTTYAKRMKLVPFKSCVDEPPSTESAVQKSSGFTLWTFLTFLVVGSNVVSSIISTIGEHGNFFRGGAGPLGGGAIFHLKGGARGEFSSANADIHKNMGMNQKMPHFLAKLHFDHCQF